MCAAGSSCFCQTLQICIYWTDYFGDLVVRFRTTSGLDSAVDPIQMKNVTFEHVKGVEEAKSELQDVVEFLKNPQKFTVLGGKLPKGIDAANSFHHFLLIIKKIQWIE